MKTLEQSGGYRIEYLTCNGGWYDLYAWLGRMLTKDEVDRWWNIAYSNFKFTPGKRHIRLVDENGRDMDE